MVDARAELIDRLRDDLAAADFTVAHLGELWGADAAAALTRAHRVPAERALDRNPNFDAAASLARVFVLGLAVEADQLARALPTLGLAGAAELGLIALAALIWWTVLFAVLFASVPYLVHAAPDDDAIRQGVELRRQGRDLQIVL